MATGDRLPTNQDPLAGLSQMLATLGGTKETVTKNPGDITALQQLISQLQGSNYEQLLQSVFQQAAGQIPGIQTALGNAVGARSGGNSAVQAALQELLKQTTLAGQKQITDQQLANQQIQAQAGGAIANATQGTKATATSGTNLTRAAGVLGLLQGIAKLTGADKTPGGLAGQIGKVFGVSQTPQATQGFGNGGAGPQTVAVGNQPVRVAAAPQQANFAPAAIGTQLANVLAQPGMGSYDWTGGVALDPSFGNYSNMFANQANQVSQQNGMNTMDALMQVTNGFGTMPSGGGSFNSVPAWTPPPAQSWVSNPSYDVYDYGAYF
jgi:hypothetical protein